VKATADHGRWWRTLPAQGNDRGFGALQLGSERLTGATLDRLTHRCQIIETKGESYRLQDAKARSNRMTAKRSSQPLDLAPSSK
jgi:hypothetical protein